MVAERDDLRARAFGLRHSFFHTIMSLPLIASDVPSVSHRRVIGS